VLGLDLTTFTIVHVVISLIGIATGFAVMRGMTTARLMEGTTRVFLVTTVLTSVTGFMFPFVRVLPAHIIGGISLVALAVTIVARYGYGLAGPWRTAYAVGALTSQYFNVFVLVAQFFRRIPFLHALAPTESEPPFLAAEVVVLLIFVALGRRSVKGFRAR
jgi:hypothetical protein